MKLFRRSKGAAVIILSGFVIVVVSLTALGCLQVKITLSMPGEYTASAGVQERYFIVPVRSNVTCGNRTGLREGRQLDRNSTQVKHDNGNDPVIMETALPPKYPDDGVPKVIIVGYYRGGTSLTGSLFNWNPNSIYYFEPLHFLFQHAVNHGADIKYNNDTVEIAPSQGHEVPYIHQFLKGLLTCNFDEVNRGTFAGGMAPMSGSDIHQFTACVRANKSKTHADICLKHLQERCLKKDVRVVKEIRLRMESTRGLLKALPSLKIIHLIRDSRGLLCSQTYATCKIGEGLGLSVCGQMYVDIKNRLKLEKEFPGRLMTLRYEDLAVNPLHTVESVYDFVNLKVPVSVGRELYNATIRGKKPKGMLDVVRLDSLKTAFGWKQNIKWEVAKNVQNICRFPLLHGKYRFYANEKDLRNEKMPVRKHYKLEDIYKN